MRPSSRPRIRAILPCLIAMEILSGCAPAAEPGIGEATIVFPADGAVFAADSMVDLRARLPWDAPGRQVRLEWSSDLQGPLGGGAYLRVLLQPGDHRIEVTSPEGPADTIHVSVRRSETALFSWYARRLSEPLTEIFPQPGTYRPVSLNLSRQTVTYRLRIPAPVQAADRPALIPARERGRLSLGSDRLAALVCHAGGPMRPAREAAQHEPGDTRSFRVAEVEAGTGVPGRVCAALLARRTAAASLWVDQSAGLDAGTLDSMAATIDSLLLPRLRLLLGSIYDADGDGRVAVLVTPIVNATGTAIGFFNPADFFPYDGDSGSETYNPTSNEMDLVYLAEPVGDASHPAYGLDSVLATAAHELAHMINFSHKTIPFSRPEGEPVQQQELFLDEGIAHLAEALCGFGVSGGTVAFAARYLQGPWRYSLSDDDGAADSVGKRGGTALLLSWLFWRAGGARWTEDPATIVDQGGIAFLHRLISSSTVGWRSIEEAQGETRDILLREYARAIAEWSAGTVPLPGLAVDPVRLEPVSLHPCMGRYATLGTTVTLSGPAAPDSGSPITAEAASICWYGAAEISAEPIEVTCDEAPAYFLMDCLRVE